MFDVREIDHCYCLTVRGFGDFLSESICYKALLPTTLA